MSDKIRLNLGSGRDYRPGWYNIDHYFPGQIDVNNDIVTLPSFQANFADEMLSSHSLEHLGKHEAMEAVRRWLEVLKPGGKLTIIVPNIPVQMRVWLEAYEAGEPDVWGFRSQTIWGNQNSDGEFHRYGYDIDSLYKLLEDAGFVDITIKLEPGKDLDFEWVEDGQMTAEAYKP